MKERVKDTGWMGMKMGEKKNGRRATPEGVGEKKNGQKGQRR